MEIDVELKGEKLGSGNSGYGGWTKMMVLRESWLQFVVCRKTSFYCLSLS